MARKAQIVPSDIFGANNEEVDNLVRDCLTSICTKYRDDIRSYINLNHRATGMLVKSIRYRTWRRKSGKYVGKVYIDDRNLYPEGSNTPYSEFIMEGTRDLHPNELTHHGFPRKLMVAKFKDGRWAKFNARRGIIADPFFERIISEDSMKVDAILNKNMEVFMRG